MKVLEHTEPYHEALRNLPKYDKNLNLLWVKDSLDGTLVERQTV